MISIFSAIMAAVVVSLVVLKGLFGQGPKAQRIALCMIGAGIVWAGPTRFLGMPPGLGDLLLVFGIAVLLWHVVTPDWAMSGTFGATTIEASFDDDDEPSTDKKD